MQTAKSLILCPQHSDCALNKVNPDPESSQHAYCPECILQYEDPATMYKKFPTLSAFIDTSAASLSEKKEKTKSYEQLEKVYLDVLAGKAESLNRFSAHLAEQKEEINHVYDELKNSVIEILEQHRAQHIQTLEKELDKLNELYENLEKMLTYIYPKKEDVDKMFPSIEELQKQLIDINEPAELQEFLKNIKQKLYGSETQEVFVSYEDDLKRHLVDDFIEHLRNQESQKPRIEQKFNDVELAKKELQAPLQGFFGSLISLKDVLHPEIFHFPKSGSKLVHYHDLLKIKGWLPERYAFKPKLLYRASEHGFSNAKFHELCDDKGPTITLINCLFDEAKEDVVIGGFLDQSWHSKNEDIESGDSFLFSLSTGIKCPLVTTGAAAHGSYKHGPAFAGVSSWELVVNKDSSDCHIHERYYRGSAKLANSETWSEGKISFKLLDYEILGFDTN